MDEENTTTISKDEILDHVRNINPLVYELAIERARTQKLQEYVAKLEQKQAESSTTAKADRDDKGFGEPTERTTSS